MEEYKMKKITMKRLAYIILPLIIAAVSFFGVSKITTNPESYQHTIQSLDEKKSTVMELTAASTAVSAAITLIPGDAGTPIAEKLVDLSSYFLVILAAIYLEKYLLTIIGAAVFKFLVPLGCVLLAASVGFKKSSLQQTARKLIGFGIILFLVIPVSVRVSETIEKTYESSVNETIKEAQEIVDQADDEAAEDDSEDKNAVTQWFSDVKDSVSKTTANAENMIKNSLNRFVEAIAVMIVTSCVIPVLVLVFFVWLIKVYLGVNLPPVNFSESGKRVRKSISKLTPGE